MTIQLKIPNLACEACVKNITKTVVSLDSQALVQADTKTKQVTIETQKSESSIRDALISAGYPPV